MRDNMWYGSAMTDERVRLVAGILGEHVPLYSTAADAPENIAAAAAIIAALDAPAKALAVRDGTVVESTKRGTHLPEDWQPSDRVQTELVQKYPNLNFWMILEEFRDYWCAVPGQRGSKLSWDRTFRNRVREVAHLPRYQRRRGLSTVDQKVADLQAMKEPE